MLELLLRPASFGQVGYDPDASRLRIGGLDGPDADLSPEPAAVVAPEPELFIEALPLVQQALTAIAHSSEVVVVEEEAFRRLAEQFCPWITEQLLDTTVDVGDFTLPDKDDADHGIIENGLLVSKRRLQPLLTRPQLVFRRLQDVDLLVQFDFMSGDSVTVAAQHAAHFILGGGQ